MRPDPQFLTTETGQLGMSRGTTSRPLSATSALRLHRQRKESEQLALNELNVMTEQLLSIPQRLYESGIAKQQVAQLQQAMEAYTRLATITWEGVTTDTLGDIYNSSTYRQYFTGANRAVNALLQEAANVRPSIHEVIKLSTPLYWKSRIACYEASLLLWRTAIGINDQTSPDLILMGQAVESLRATVGLGGMSYAGIFLNRATNIITFIAGIGILAVFVAATASAYTVGQKSTGITFSIFTVFLLLFVGMTLWAASSSMYALQTVTGATYWRLFDRDDQFGRNVLTGWRWLIQSLFLVGLFGVAGIGIREIIISLPSSNGSIFSGPFLFYLDGFTLRIAPYLIAVAGIALAQPWIAALPVTVSYQVMLSSDLARGKEFIPIGRLPFLQPALQILVYHLFWLLAIISSVFVTTQMNLPTLLAYPHIHVTYLGVILLAAVVLLYGITIELPYRLGSHSYKQTRTATIAKLQYEAKGKLAEIGPYPTQVNDTQAFQLNVSRMEYLRMQSDDLTKMRMGPYRWWELVGSFITVTAGVVIIDNGREWISLLFR